jgi:ribose/xylose/arabinose/galactoside ABC-type transport system permease subunit
LIKKLICDEKHMSAALTKRIAERNQGLYAALAVLLLAAVVINFATGVNFFRISNLLNVTRSFCMLGIASIGQAVVIISGGGGLDLSVGETISTANVIAATFMKGNNALFVPVTLLTLLFGAVVGLTNGLLVTKRNVPPFIATLGMAILLRGLRLMWTEGLPQGKIPPVLVKVGVSIKSG